MNSITNHRTHCRNGLFVMVLAGALGALSPVAVWAEAEVSPSDFLRRGFADVAHVARPAVVFIQVEKTITVRGRSGAQSLPFNDPFELFGDEFFERFFGPRTPRTTPRSGPREFRQSGQGSGFIVREDGYILTNNHVVGDADRIRVRLQDGREFDAKRIGADPRTEIAVIKIDAQDLPTVRIGSVENLETGEWVMAIGNPFGLSETVTVGVVSAKGRSGMGIADYEDFIQTDAAINPGNSGGPLLNISGEVVGINTAIFSRSGGYMGIGFAIPIDMAMGIMQQLIDDGRVTRGYLGIMLNPGNVDEPMAKSFGLERAGGVLVAEVMDETPAAEAGIKSGDIILKVDGRNVTDNHAFRRDMAALRPGTELKLNLFRDGEQMERVVVVGLFPEDAAAEAEPEEPVDLEGRLGAQLQEVTPEIAQRLNIPSEIGGVVVTAVEPGGPAERAGLRPGLRIVAVNRSEINSVEDLRSAITRAEGPVRMRVASPEGRSWFVVLNPRDLSP